MPAAAEAGEGSAAPPPAADEATPAPPPPSTPPSDEDAAAARAALDDLLSLARSPVDLLSFGPRVALGALLSLPDLTDRL